MMDVQGINKSYCAICKKKYADLEAHLHERHSDPSPHVWNVGDKEVEMTEAEYVRNYAILGAEDDEETHEKQSVPPVPTILDAIGILSSDIEIAEPVVVAGASCSLTEVKYVFDALDEYMGFKVERGHFVVSFVEWGLKTSFSEELSDAGGWLLKSTVASAPKEKMVKAEDMHDAISKYLARHGLARSFTFRRLGRALGATIATMVSKNPTLNKYTREGTDMSNRLGVPAENMLCCTSIFEYIKPYVNWTDSEKKAWEAHNTSVKKRARGTGGGRDPADLRIDPERSSVIADSGYDDFNARIHERYGQGQNIFNKMWSNEDKRLSGDRRGL